MSLLSRIKTAIDSVNPFAVKDEDIETPEKSPIFSKYPKFLADHHAVHFICDTLRMAISGGVPAFERACRRRRRSRPRAGASRPTACRRSPG